MPNIKIEFTNQINTSVQVGDIAYFSNPTLYGTIETPTTVVGNIVYRTSLDDVPHLTGDQSDIIKIGEILEIGPWNGTDNYIICEMPQNLFNQYYSLLQSVICNLVVTESLSTCGDHTPLPKVGRLYSSATNYSYLNAMKWFFDNPTINFNDVSFHMAQTDPHIGGCEVEPGIKNVDGYVQPAYLSTIAILEPGDDFYIVDPNQPPSGTGDIYNYWVEFTHITMNPGLNWNGDINGNPIYLYDSSIPGYTSTAGNSSIPYKWHANDVLTGIPMFTSTITNEQSNGEGNNFQAFFDWIDNNFPGVTTTNMTWDEYFNALAPFGVREPTADTHHVLDGSISFEEDCAGKGSFIMFSKDNKANLSSVLGYYASVTFKNNSTDKAELFNVGASIFESSK